MKRHGFTILEALVALVLLGIVITGLTPMFRGAKSSQVGSYTVEQGSQYAEFRIDSLRSLGRAVLAKQQIPGNWTSPALPLDMGMTTGTWMWMLDTPAVAGKAGTLTVRVLWHQGSVPHQIELQGAMP
ncbi:MAG TPA: prepilin-type N-terminal cleavage/methylation domain-containing protein [Fibrobacteria bacterium]|nr:prepilin-type N-terminal cleavage/methylation domain-containing protein [Fibrobacteria bacterium]